jgi:hypothetical protein
LSPQDLLLLSDHISDAPSQIRLNCPLKTSSSCQTIFLCIFFSSFFIIAENAEILSDCTDEVQTSFMDRNFIKIIRVFYTTGSQLQSQPVQHFASRLFLPIRVGRRMFEGMSQTMYRIEAWLRLTGNDTLTVNVFNRNYSAILATLQITSYVDNRNYS